MAFQAEGGLRAMMQQWKEQGMFWLLECSGGQWATRQAVERSGGSHGWVQSLQGNPSGNRQGRYEVQIPESSIRLSHCPTLACRDLWGQAPCFPWCFDEVRKRDGSTVV